MSHLTPRQGFERDAFVYVDVNRPIYNKFRKKMVLLLMKLFFMHIISEEKNSKLNDEITALKIILT